ncbi:hypothetical protein [Gracilibacillus orientalis]|nr:hypothetical protein [Gracilibacillus orientalis]
MSVWSLGIVEVERVLFFPDELNDRNKFGGNFSFLSINGFLKIIDLCKISKINLTYYTDVPVEQTRMNTLFTYIESRARVTIDFIPYEREFNLGEFRSQAVTMKRNSIKSFLTGNYDGMDFRRLKHIYCDHFSLLNDWEITNDMPLNSVIITENRENYSDYFNVMYINESHVLYDSEQLYFDQIKIASLTTDECQIIYKQLKEDHTIHYLVPKHDLIPDLTPKLGIVTLNLLYVYEDGVYCKFKDGFIKLGALNNSLDTIVLNVTLLTNHERLKDINLIEAVLYYAAKLKYDHCRVGHILLSNTRREHLVEHLWDILIFSKDNHYVIVDIKNQNMRKVKLFRFDLIQIIDQYNEKNPLNFASDIGFSRKIKQKLLGAVHK